MDTKNWSDEKLYFFLKNLGLSPREIHVASALLVLKTDKEIAAKLHIAESTVHSHRVKIYKKLNAHDRAEFVINLQNKGLFKD